MKISNLLALSPASAAVLQKRDETTTLVYEPTTFTRHFWSTTSVVVVDVSVTHVIADGTTVTWVADHEGEQTDITVPGVTTTLEIPAVTERFTLSLLESGVVILPQLSGIVNFGDASTDIYIPGQFTTVTISTESTAELAAPGTTSIVEYPGTVIHLENPDGAYTTVVQVEPVTLGLVANGEASTMSLPGTTVTLSRDGTSVVLTAATVTNKPGSVLPGEESSTSTFDSASYTERVPYPTCEAVKSPPSPDEETLLKILFGGTMNGYTFTDYVIWNAEGLLTQISYVLEMDYPVGDQDVVTNFSTLGYSGILALASAAPMYTCFLSSLWAEALAHPQQYAKRDEPSQDEKIKLIVLFEKHIDDDGEGFAYADLLVEETNKLLRDLREVSGAAANNTDVSNYAAIFDNLDVQQFLSMVPHIEIYTFGMSQTIQSLLDAYSKTAYPATTLSEYTRAFTTVDTYVTDYKGANITLPTTIVGSELVAVVCRNSQCKTETMTMTESQNVEVIIEDGRPVTRTVTPQQTAEPSIESSAPVPESTMSTPSIESSAPVPESTTSTPSIEVQKENGAFKHVVTLGLSLLGLLVLLV